jgi:hypothetical protein
MCFPHKYPWESTRKLYCFAVNLAMLSVIIYSVDDKWNNTKILYWWNGTRWGKNPKYLCVYSQVPHGLFWAGLIIIIIIIISSSSSSSSTLLLVIFQFLDTEEGKKFLTLENNFQNFLIPTESVCCLVYHMSPCFQALQLMQTVNIIIIV